MALPMQTQKRQYQAVLHRKLKKKLDKIHGKCTVSGRNAHCLVWPSDRCGITADGYGRISLTYPGLPRVETTVHRAVFILSENRPDLIKSKTAGDVSHLCHEKRCVTKEHLWLESRARNMLRNACASSGKCQCKLTPSCIFSPKQKGDTSTA